MSLTLPDTGPATSSTLATGNVLSLQDFRGKVPPQNLELEMTVLGAIILERDAFSRVSDALREEVFYKPAHQIIFKAIRELFHNAQPIDLHTLSHKLRQLGQLQEIGGAFYLSELTSRVASAANLEFHARILVEKYVQRELITTCTNLQRDAYDESQDVFELLNKAELHLYNLSGNNLRRDALSIRDLSLQTIDHLQELRLKEEKITGISTGFGKLDELTSGWQPSDLIIIAARPAMGKTAFVLSLARNAAVGRGVPVMMFSLEMSARQLAQRLMCAEAELDAQKVRTGKLEGYEWEQLNLKTGELSNAPLYIDDTPGLGIYDMRAKCRRMKAEKGIGMIIVDYLQLMSGDARQGTNREQEIAKISRSLKMLAKELDVPVIALSQLSRSVETRPGNKRPMLSDLRESGSIEQDADVVIFLYRPEYYKFTEDEQGNSTAGVCEVIVGKQRSGPTDTVRLHFINQYGKFRDLVEPGQGFSLRAAGGGSGFSSGTGLGFSSGFGGTSSAPKGPDAGNSTFPSRLNTGFDDIEEDFSAPF